MGCSAATIRHASSRPQFSSATPDRSVITEADVMGARRKASRLAWFATDSGKRFTLGCAVSLGVSASAINILPHSLLLDKYREFFQLHRKSTPVRVSPKIKKLYDTVLEDLKVPEDVRANLKLFTVNGFDVFHAGTTALPSGALVGVPTNFDYEVKDDIDTSTLLIRSKHIDWNKPEGRSLISSLTLSEDARKFALGREIVRCQTAEPIINALGAPVCIGLAYAIGKRVNVLLNGFARPLSFRLSLYALTGLFGLGNWIFMKDATTVRYDAVCDTDMSKLGKEYVRGGQEFYDKLLQRNVALRSLLGREGTKLYSACGNEQFFIRHKRLPNVHRKLYFDELMESPE